MYAPLVRPLCAAVLLAGMSQASDVALRLEPSPDFPANPSVVRVSLYNVSPSPGVGVDSFGLGIGDPTQQYDFAVNEALSSGSSATQFLPPDDANDGVGTDSAAFDCTGFGAGASLRFDLDIDSVDGTGVGAPFYETLFDRDGTDSADNALVTVQLSNGVTISSRLPDFAATADDIYTVRFPDRAALGTSYCPLAANSFSSGAVLSVLGSASVAQASLRLQAAGVPNTAGLFFYGTTRVQVPFGDGFRCVGGALTRIQPPLALSNHVASRDVDFGAPSAAGILAAGAQNAELCFQLWFRDPGGPGGSGFNLSDARAVRLEP